MNTSKKSPHFSLQPVSAACLVLIMLTATNLTAAPLNLAQVPAGNSGREPAPNVILSVDDSGSMGWDVNGCQTPSTVLTSNDAGATNCPSRATNLNPTRMFSLQAALRTQFGDGTANSGLIADNSIRLAWQAMHDNGNGTTNNPNRNLTVGAANSMKRFGGTHRTNFNNFVTSLRPQNGTPSHQMMLNAYNYMKTPAGTNSPWADNPGVSQSTDYLACRRTYHVFMTDGAWNGQGTLAAVKVDGTNGGDGASRNLPSPHASLNLTPLPPAQYDPTSGQVNVYRDQWGDVAGVASTLSDFAFRSWAEDLQPAMDNKIKPLIRQSGNETVGATPLEEFWNPRNDPATWQHITQHTIGFGSGATTWGAGVAPLWSPADNNYGSDGDYPNLVNGTVSWPTPDTAHTGNNARPLRTSELWHAALNGRGKFYPARNPAALSTAFRDILDNILGDTTSQPTSISANGAALSANSKSYVAGYDAKKWSGQLKAFSINATTGVANTVPTWSATGLGPLNASNQIVVNDPGKLDHPTYPVADRLVVSYNGTAGIPWKTYANLPALQRTPLNNSRLAVPDGNGQNRVDYIRGDRTKEESQPGGIFRNRDSRLGDIVNSKILYLGKPVSNYGELGYATFKRPAGSGNRANMLYVGANDGMLHAFDAATGVEKLAYIPQGIAQGDLRKLTDPNYTHQYFVDGTPFAGDAKVGPSTTPLANPWKTVLVAGLGGGGKGYVALDATNAADFTAGNEGNLVIADTTASADPEIGNMYITPAIDPADVSRSSQIVRVNAPESTVTLAGVQHKAKHRWALVVGNGYNSTHEAPVLIVQYLDGGNDPITGQKYIKKISPCIPLATRVFNTACAYTTSNGRTINGSTSNGLSTPRLVDLNDDGIVDVAYAGDLAGNVWKFDLSSQNHLEWKTSFNDEPFFKAKPGQSFTTAPYVDSNFTAGSGVQVHISSGKNLRTEDQTSNITETTYSLWDNSRFGLEPVPNTSPVEKVFKIIDSNSSRINTSNVMPGTLVQQTISTSPFTEAGNNYYTSSSNPVDYERASGPDRGWYMDWRKPGQRVLRNSKSFDGQKISIYSTVPSSATVANNVESCSPGVNSEQNFLTILNMFTGKPSKARTYDLSDTIAAATRASTTTVELPPGDFVEVKTRNANGKLGAKVVSACKEGQVCKPPIDTPWGSYVGVKAGWGSKQ